VEERRLSRAAALTIIAFGSGGYGAKVVNAGAKRHFRGFARTEAAPAASVLALLSPSGWQGDWLARPTVAV